MLTPPASPGTPPLSLHISINARRATAPGWGDYQYAISLARALERLGHRATLFYRDEAPQLSGQRDAVIRITGPHLDEPVPGVPNLLWMISPPNLCPLAALARYQHLFFASAPLAAAYAGAGMRSSALLQCADGDTFNAQANDGLPPVHDIAFVGNLAPRAPRANVRMAVGLGFDVRIWGRGWEDAVPARHIAGTRVDSVDLARIYAASRIVLNSHMPDMARLGFMSNRSFDALACGAVVVSDQVAGFQADAVPGLYQAGPDQNAMAALLRGLLAAPESPADRAARGAAALAGFSFDARARVLADAAARLLAEGRRAAPILRFLPPRPATGPTRQMHLQDMPAQDEMNRFQPDPGLDPQGKDQGPAVTLALSDPSASAPGVSAAEAMRHAAGAVLRIGALLASEAALAGLEVTPPPPETRRGVIHAAMADHRRAQEIALMGVPARQSPEARARLTELCQRARRLLEFRNNETHPLQRPQSPGALTKAQVRLMNDRPLYAHSPADFQRERQKRHLQLWPRNGQVGLRRPVGVFLHLFYSDLAPVFRARLEVLDVPHRIHISTDTAEKAAAIARHFPDADIRITPNRGRDVFAKLYGFPGAYRDHDIVLHLHGKKSPHAQALDQWLAHCLDALLPAPAETARILSLFQSVPALGIVAPLVFPTILGAAHWGDNREIAEELAIRMGLKAPLPDNAGLEFPAGSMFWARTEALRPLLDLDLQPEHFPAEKGQLDATTAHAIERLYGIACRAAGLRLIRVAPTGSHMHKTHRITASTNREVRDALEAGAFDE